MGPDLLPDSRARRSTREVWRAGMWWVRVYCAGCGKEYGLVPKENCRFACWLCDDCAPKYGEQAGVMFMPDEVFWQTVLQEQIDVHGRLLTEAELQAELDAGTTPLGKLLKEGV